MKTCKKCHLSLPADSFYKSVNTCKPCYILAVKKRAAENPEKLAAYEAKRYKENPDRKIRMREYAKTENGKKAKARGIARYIAKNPEKRKAHSAVSNAIRDKRLFRQPCEVCGELKVQAHHDDYSKPLEVRWLCVRHHVLVHSTNSRNGHA